MARIRHLAIVTENRERLVKFYTTAFGMKVVEGVGPAIYLSDGYINVAIIQRSIEAGNDLIRRGERIVEEVAEVSIRGTIRTFRNVQKHGIECSPELRPEHVLLLSGESLL